MIKETPVKFAVYKADKPGVSVHPREILGYAWEENDGSIIVERPDGKKVRMILP